MPPYSERVGHVAYALAWSSAGDDEVSWLIEWWKWPLKLGLHRHRQLSNARAGEKPLPPTLPLDLHFMLVPADVSSDTIE